MFCSMTFNLARTLLAVFLMSAIRSSSSCFTFSSVCGADRIALCFFFTSSTLACILSMFSRISSTSAKNSSMKLAPSSTVTETSSSPCAALRAASRSLVILDSLARSQSSPRARHFRLV
uniref:Secreted protein n=1 Tax=Ixodes ricinus TaxID=34613 RepID=A0A147BVZ6_IXORI